ncbi:MAG TPA: SRPBCC family protein [Mycobacteriales bacterium]|nr:SRPBCC family protein [Mycobacteriales bacterium]
MPQLEKVDLSYFDSAPTVIRTSAHIAAPRPRVFAAIAEDPAGWGRWFPGFDATGHWETSAPHGVGSVRVIRAFRVRFREEILAWDRDERWAFRVIDMAMPMAKAFAEDYRLSDDGSGTRLDWTVAQTGVGMKLAGPLGPVIFQRVLNTAARKLARVA